MNMEVAETASTTPAVPPLAAPGDVTRDTMGDLRGMLGELGLMHERARARGDSAAAKSARTQTRECERLLSVMSGTLSGANDLAVLLLKQPTAAQLAAPGRISLLKGKVGAALEKSKFLFHDPEVLLICLAAIMGEHYKEETLEVQHRILHFLAEANLTKDGVSVAAMMSRIIRAAKDAALSCRGPEADSMRAALIRFLTDARARPEQPRQRKREGTGNGRA